MFISGIGPWWERFLPDKSTAGDSGLRKIQHLETFLLELGGDFTFVGRQRRLRVGDAWYRVASAQLGFAAVP
ncbi:MAG TPA: PDDEXK nuclease domain-containing protein [Polyangiaceae bacterium]|nr:PDDEXK nuclease domain-containing protein [Polyangiaceae bacterium]